MSEPTGQVLPHVSDERLLDFKLALLSGQELSPDQQIELISEIERQNATIYRLAMVADDMVLEIHRLREARDSP